MEQNSKKADIRNAILLGGFCAIAYLAVYVARNLLSAVTPGMVADGVLTKEQIGTLSSAFFVSYAVGQLINGRIGEAIKAKYMICLGLFLAGVCHIVFPIFAGNWIACFIAYALVGLFLSMIYAPMTKVVAESMSLVYATRSTLGFTFSSFLGSPIAGLLGAWMTWQGVFYTGSSIMMAMGVICFLAFTVMERKSIIRYPEKREKVALKGGIRILIKHRIIRFVLVSILTGVVRTTVVFWLPTYISERLQFSPEKADLIFTVTSFIIAFSTFVGVGIYELLRRKMNLTLFLSFFASAVFFLLTFFVENPVANIILLVLSILSSNSAATILWSVYCPSLRDTGFVSSATGFLDFASYMAAAISSSVFANSVSTIGWGGLVLVWFGLMVLGVIVSLPFDKLRKKRDGEDEEVTERRIP